MVVQFLRLRQPMFEESCKYNTFNSFIRLMKSVLMTFKQVSSKNHFSTSSSECSQSLIHFLSSFSHIVFNPRATQPCFH
eukprot:UN10687